MIRNLTQKGVRQDEIAWSGVLDWLEAQDGPVSREELLAYLRQNEVRVEEVVKGAGAELPGDRPRYLDYTLPGGENYRELLLTLPPDPRRGDYTSSHWEERNVLFHVRFSERIDADGKRVLHIEKFQSDWHQAGRKSGYRS